MKENQSSGKRKIPHIPIRFILAILLAILEIAMIVGIVIALSYYVPYFYLAVWATEIACVVRIIASDDNPDYKIPWLMCVLLIPIAGFMLYFLFYSRTLKKKYVRRLENLKNHSYVKDDTALFDRLAQESPAAHNQARMICNIADAHLFTDTKQTYFPLGEDMHKRMLEDLRKAKKFIYLEYFIIEEGLFWNSILEILKEKAAQGLDVKVIYDDIGCMATLHGNYDDILGDYGIGATTFSKLKGNADSEFNNRSHRKIMVIDGNIGYTGGVNLADEYINEVVKYGHWKDIGIRLEGDAVKELTKLFLIDFGLNVKTFSAVPRNYFPELPANGAAGYMIPFGDGPDPIYKHRVGKCVIQNMLNNATRYVYMMSPYLIIDNELCQTIENAALRGVDVRLITPHVPDKWIILEMTRSYYQRLIAAGVKIYEYEPGFIHAKCYLADDEIAMIGTINLDYRSLVHHFENGVWMYRCDSIQDIKADFDQTFEKSVLIDAEMANPNLSRRALRAMVKVFSPLL